MIVALIFKTSTTSYWIRYVTYFCIIAKFIHTLLWLG